MDSVEMEPNLSQTSEIHTEAQEPQESQSVENFQKFIYELFEKNGVLNDLRAYLRGHIVNVIKSAQTGDPPACQKHFTQRLELTFQALNMIIAEYFLRLEFGYTLSVFVSEIPLANMVFDFAKTLLLNLNVDYTELRFKENDVWSILNYLGIQCDSDHASNILQMYKSDEHAPLLLCILKCMPMYRKETYCVEQANSSQDSLTSSCKSTDTLDEKNGKSNPKNSSHEKCKHYAFCKTCQGRFLKLREKYRKKKKFLAKDLKDSNFNPSNVELLMKNISVMERSLINEMFEQLKSVYETEVEMVKIEEEKKVKRSLANHAQQLKKHQFEIEEAFKAREKELERNVQQKKKFLWGLARALREQHEQMSRAMCAVRDETGRLTAKETSLKDQLMEAEDILRRRGEEMRGQIAAELAILEEHLESMKKERDNIHRERSELEQLKLVCDSNSKFRIHNMETNEDLRSHYDLLKNEMSILKKYLESTKMQAKCVIERSTMTEWEDSSKLNVLLNNVQSPDQSYTEERTVKTPNQVVNDFKKLKNVNFSQSNLDEIYGERSRERSRSSASSDAGDAEPERSRLRADNVRLRLYARQQRERIDELTSQQARLQAELGSRQPFRPRPAPAPARPAPPSHHYSLYPTASASANTFGWRKGAGEELSLFSNAQPRIVLPGDTLPFIGVLRDRHNDNRRHLASQWRVGKQRAAPLGGVVKGRPLSPARDRPSSAPHRQTHEESDDTPSPNRDYSFASSTCEKMPRPRSPLILGTRITTREKSPKSVLREAKEKLRNKGNIKDCPPATTREKSPNSVLREAKLRLRKLEIEAEAVEKSYLDFRKRQTVLKEERKTYSLTNEEAVVTKDVGALEVRRSKSLQKLDDAYRGNTSHARYNDAQAAIRDFDKYLREYETKLNIGEKYFNNNAAAKTKPIPDAYSKNKEIDKPEAITNDNYLETPLAEFRKLYHSSMPSRPFQIIDNSQRDNRPKSPQSKDTSDVYSYNKSDERKELEAIKQAKIKEKNSKKAELEILKQNINKMYNLKDAPTAASELRTIDDSVTKREPTPPIAIPKGDEGDKNLIRVEVENVCETNKIKLSDSPLNLLLVQSSVDRTELVHSDSEQEGEKINTNMTIIISPKRSSPRTPDTVIYNRSPSPNNPRFGKSQSPDRARRSMSPEQAARLTRNDVLDAIFHADTMNEVSSLDMHPDVSKDGVEDSISEVDHPHDDYPDDFSADVDNYNSRSEYDNHSPVSLPKTSEDENFWDS